MPSTLKDVAKRAGVSIKTVSNVVHGYAHVKDEMRERVQMALKELNYQPNIAARYLRKGSLGLFTLVIPELENPYFSDLSKAIVTVASSHSYTILNYFIDNDKKDALELNRMYRYLFDGIILSPLVLEFESLLLQEVNVPLVLVGEPLFNVPYDHIIVDNIAAARLATEHLLSLGRKRIAVIGAQEENACDKGHSRQQGYLEALAQVDIIPDPELIISVSSFDRVHGIRAMQHLLSLNTPPDAIFCFDDLLALGAMRALYDADYLIPKDIAVVGFTNIEEASFSMPSLTTVALDTAKIGELAIDSLLRRIKNAHYSPPQRIEIPIRLIVRESTVGRSSQK